jgi:hypothetical protein
MAAVVGQQESNSRMNMTASPPAKELLLSRGLRQLSTAEASVLAGWSGSSRAYPTVAERSDLRVSMCRLARPEHPPIAQPVSDPANVLGADPVTGDVFRVTGPNEAPRFPRRECDVWGKGTSGDDGTIGTFRIRFAGSAQSRGPNRVGRSRGQVWKVEIVGGPGSEHWT